MNRFAASLRYARDIGEVLFLDRLTAPPTRRDAAAEAATIVRRVRFHSHAKIPSIPLPELLSLLQAAPVSEVTLPGPRELAGVGNATYYHALASLACALRPSSVLEFGTYLGVGTLTIALNSSPDCRILTVDLPDEAFIDESHGLSRGDVELIGRRRARVGEAFRGLRLSERIEQVRADSLTWHPRDSLTSVDLVLIDGGHSDPLVRADTENAFNVLSPTGTVLWDDYFYMYPDVVRFLDALVDEGRRLHVIDGTNLVIYDPRLQ